MPSARPLLAALLLIGPVIASAQESPDIIVEGERNRDKRIFDFVEALTPAPKGGQISRFDRPVCPAATGLSDEQNSKIVARMRTVAKAAGMPLAKAKCQPNTIVALVDNKDEFIREMRKKFPAYFSTSMGVPIGQIDAGKVAAWHVEGLLDANGSEAGIVVEHAGKADSGGASSLVTERTKRMVTASTDTSRTMPSSRPHLVSGVLVIERAAINGLDMMQVADYAAMRLYAETEPERMTSLATPTILTILDAPMNSAVPKSLTEWDLTFLKSLYATDGLQFATLQRAAIRQKFRKELGTGQNVSGQ
jgi:hypothetical protein